MLRGLVAATFTPMNADGSLALESVPAVVDRLAAQGLAAIFVCGSTGEGTSLSSLERMRVAEAYAAAAAGRLPVIVHVGHNSLAEAGALAAHAAELDVLAIAATPPSYYPLTGAEHVVDCLEKIVRHAPATPLYYYHIPRLTGVDIDVHQLLDIAESRIPTLTGIKYSDPSIDLLQSCVIRHGKRVNFLFGVDEMLLSGLVAGAHGAVGSTYNFLGREFGRVIAAFERGDVEAAARYQARASEVIHTILHQSPALSALKAALALAGVDCGPPRLPLAPLGPQQVGIMRDELSALGLFR